MDLAIDRAGPLPIHEQLTGQIRLFIDSGSLKPGDRLPSIKALAERLALNPNTVAASYRALEAEGYLRQRKRAGTVVAPAPPRRLEGSLTAKLASDLAARARALGLDSGELTRAVAASCAIHQDTPRLSVAVLADSPLRAAEHAERVQAVLGSGAICTPLTPREYASVDFHLTVIDPRLGGRLVTAPASPAASVAPASYLAYGPEFPAAAD